MFTPEEAALIDIDQLVLDTTHSVSKEFQEIFSDVIYETRQRGTESLVYITLLLEHKSTPDKYTLVQLLSYMVSKWLIDIAVPRPLSLIIPVVFLSRRK